MGKEGKSAVETQECNGQMTMSHETCVFESLFPSWILKIFLSEHILMIFFSFFPSILLSFLSLLFLSLLVLETTEAKHKHTHTF